MAAALENLMNPIPPRSAEAEIQKFDDVLKEQKVPLRSWRKKYRKMKIRFDRQMDESNKLWMDCHKLEALSKRLQEENDLLLESLLHLNETSPLPSYDLGDIHTDIVPSIESVPPLEPDAPRTLSSLLNIPHAALTASNAASFPPELLGDDLPGYLTTAYEDEYIANLDTQLATPEATDDGFAVSVTQLPKSRILPPEKEMLAANPMSVLSWLRRYHPETFIQEKEAAAENQKAHKPRSTGGAKRSSMATITSASAANAGTPQPHKEEEEGEGGEEWMHAQEEKVAGGGRGKRTRDDEAYRPKGGSSRPAKRKRGAAAAEGAEGEKPRGGKRARGSAAQAAATTPG